MRKQHLLDDRLVKQEIEGTHFKKKKKKKKWLKERVFRNSPFWKDVF